MYKFTNGFVVFDKKTKDEYLKAGYKLQEQQITVDEVLKEAKDEDSIDSGVVNKKSKQRDKITE